MRTKHRNKILGAVLGAVLLFGLAGCATDHSLLNEDSASREAVEYADKGNTDEEKADGGKETLDAVETDSNLLTADEDTDTEQYWYVTENGEIIVDDEKKAEDARYAKEVLDLELSGEYVIDYQVREEPIPKEIADIGNPCEGTIHAFPTRIEAALSEIEMAKNPELREAVEYASDHVLSHLEQETGEKFVLQDVRCIESIWWFDIMEIGTGKKYEIYCDEYKKGSAVMDGGALGTYIAQKDNEKNTIDYRKIISSIFPDTMVWVDKPDEIQIFIEIADFSDIEIDRLSEQEKCIALWNELREYDENAVLLLGIRYLPIRYKEIMDAKVNSSYKDDIMLSQKHRDLLIQAGEMMDYFYYYDFQENEYSFDKYISSGIDSELPFWATKE